MLETPKMLRMAHRLSNTILNPTNIQRASAKLALSLFHESTINALEYHVKFNLKKWQGTLIFMKVILELWNIRPNPNPKEGLEAYFYFFVSLKYASTKYKVSQERILILTPCFYCVIVSALFLNQN